MFTHITVGLLSFSWVQNIKVPGMSVGDINSSAYPNILIFSSGHNLLEHIQQRHKVRPCIEICFPAGGAEGSYTSIKPGPDGSTSFAWEAEAYDCSTTDVWSLAGCMPGNNECVFTHI